MEFSETQNLELKKITSYQKIHYNRITIDIQLNYLKISWRIWNNKNINIKF